MLVSIRVRDLAVLEDVEVAFGEGLTVLTGETGAGKSLVVDALALLSGERSDVSLIRAGAERLVVEGAFDSDDPAVADALATAGLASPQGEGIEVVIRREVAPAGRSRLFVNDSPAALKTLERIAPRLLVLYGQAEARELLDPGTPQDLLDRFAGLLPPSRRVAELHAALQEKEAERDRIAGAAADRNHRLQLLEFQIREIDAVAPRPGEDEALAAEKAVLSNVEKVGRLLSEAVQALESEQTGALAMAAAARRAFQALAEVEPSWGSRAAETGEVLDRLSDLSAAASRALDGLEADPARLAFVAERLDALARLKRKYAPTLDEVMAFREALGSEREELTDLEGALRKAEAAVQEAFEAYRKGALELSAARTAAAPRFVRGVEAHLKDLAFPKASFQVEIARRPDPSSPFSAGGERIAFGAGGVDHVSFSFAPNPGEPARPLPKIASGGELARVQLAVAATLAAEEAPSPARGRKGPRQGGPVRTFVFDEVDAGVSGSTAEAVGRKLRTLAARDQVLVVTHLPQVAAAGEHHLLVSKETQKGRTRTLVTPLQGKARIEALAAMLAGASVGEPARAQARQLLSGATP